MKKQYGTAKLSDFGFWDRVKIFFIPYRFKVKHGNHVFYYKIYKGRRVLIRMVTYEDKY